MQMRPVSVLIIFSAVASAAAMPSNFAEAAGGWDGAGRSNAAMNDLMVPRAAASSAAVGSGGSFLMCVSAPFRHAAGEGLERAVLPDDPDVPAPLRLEIGHQDFAVQGRGNQEVHAVLGKLVAESLGD